MSVRWFDRFIILLIYSWYAKLNKWIIVPESMLTVFLALRKKLEVTLDYIKSIGRKIQSFINFNISFKFVKVEIRSCCKAERPFIRLRFIPQQTHWWRRQLWRWTYDIRSVKTKSVTVTNPHSQQTALLHFCRFYRSFFNCLNFVNVAFVVYFLYCFQIKPFFHTFCQWSRLIILKVHIWKEVGCVNLVLKKRKKRESDMYEERCPLNSCDSDTVSCGRLCKLLFVVSFWKKICN